MARAVQPSDIISHWDHRIENFQESSDRFYGEVEQRIAAACGGEAKLARVKIAQGGIFSSKREYLQVLRDDHVFHVCAAPFGNGFFVSWWLGTVERGWLALLARIPLIGIVFGIIGNLFARFVKPMTYFRADTALMFQSATHGAVTEAIDAVLSPKGLRISESDRKPVMRNLFERLK